MRGLNLNKSLQSILALTGMMAGLTILSQPALAQRGGPAAPEPPGCPAAPEWFQKRQAAQAAQAAAARAAAPPAAGRGAAAGGPPAGAVGGRGRGGDGAAQPEVPRIPNEPAYGVQAGKPDFGGLAKGVWNVPYIVNLQTDAHDENGCRFIQIPFKPAAKAIWEERFLKNDMKDDPEGFCLPPGVPRMMYTPYPAQIYLMADRIVFVYEGGAHVWRLVWMDGRKLPNIDDINPDYLGYSVGRWEGDTLVIDSVGFNTSTWLDASGHPHGEQMKVTEKYTRTSFNNMKIEATITDPEYYTKPFTVVTGITWNANKTGPWTLRGGELVEYICQENNRDLVHLGAERGK
jgi:hypothetical protein